MIIEILIRLIIAIVFGLLSALFLTTSLYILKRDADIQYNAKTSATFTVLLFIFSFAPNLLLTLVATLIALFLIKYFYIHTWKETLQVWAIWMLHWIVLFGIISILQTFI